MFKKGDILTWTKEAVARQLTHRDLYDNALVIEGRRLEALEDQEPGAGSINVRDLAIDYQFPANVNSLQKAE